MLKLRGGINDAAGAFALLGSDSTGLGCIRGRNFR